jgi:hypothetical protein
MLGTGSKAVRNMIGYMGEMIAYERTLTSQEKNKIYSYLAMKYGVTIDPDLNNTTINYDYVLSNGTDVWQGTSSADHRPFHHNVAMVVRDDASDLLNKRARSTDVGDFIVMGVNGTALDVNGNDDVQGFSTDLSAVAWGNNGESYSGDLTTKFNIANLSYVCGNMDYRAKRIWMIDKSTAGDQTVLIGVGGEHFHESNANYQIFLLFSNHPDSLSTTNNQWSQVVPTHFYNGLHQASYTLTDELTYFTIGIKDLQGNCETCQFSGYKTLNFTSTNWPKGTKVKTFDLGDGFSTQIDVAINGSGSSVFYKGYPDAVSNTLREYRRVNMEAQTMTTTISHYQTGTTNYYPAAASFQIYEIDREGNALDEVEVVGYCGSDPVYPVLSYAGTAASSSYTIINTYQASAKQLPTAAYTDLAGRMNVFFDYPVEKIVVTHRASGSGKVTGFQRIGIGPVQFFCMPPIPEPNEEGLIFNQLATPSDNVSLCEKITYVFQLYNTNCVPMDVNLSDILPNGMKWRPETLQIADATGYTVNSYGGETTLEVNDLTLSPASSIRISIQAEFDETAAASTVYSNQGWLDYTNFSGVNASLLGCDRYTTNGCAPTPVTTSSATARVAPVEVTYTINKSTYNPGDSIIIRINIENDNSISIDDVSLSVSYNNAFTTLPQHFSSYNSTGTLSLQETGSFSISGITLQQGAAGWIEFALKAPTRANLEKVVDGTGNMLDKNGNITIEPNKQAVFPLLINYNFFSAGSDKCEEAAFLNANGEIQVPYNETSRAWIIGNKHISGFPKQ